MKRSLIAAAMLTASTTSFATADIGVSIGISQPGVYGRIDIGRFPQPVVVATQPVIISRPVVVAPQPPVYLWAPPGHQKNWGKHCSRYNACGVPVYFVQDGWYNQHVMADRGHDKHGGKHGNKHGNKHGKGGD